MSGPRRSPIRCLTAVSDSRVWRSIRHNDSVCRSLSPLIQLFGELHVWLRWNLFWRHKFWYRLACGAE